MTFILSQILDSKRKELPELRCRSWPREFSPRALPARRTTETQLIAEIKFRSPSAGALSTRMSVGERAEAYEAAGAAMISVLCDRPFFDGSYSHLSEARRACSIPLLCKEFILDDCQLDAAAAHGADAVLLIARCLSAEQLGHLLDGAKARGLTPLVEVFSEPEGQLAAELGADWVGVNARNLDTLEVDTAQARRVLAQLPQRCTRLHLSGVKTPEDVRAAAASGADLALVGEALMRLDDPKPLLSRLVHAGRRKSP
jgi:indole-3-glycerol phosphate synthase